MNTETTEPMLTVTVPQPHPSIMTAAKQFTALAQNYEVDCADAKVYAVEDIRSIKARWAEIEAMRKHLKQPLDEGARRIQDVFVPILDALDQAARTIKRKLDDYINVEERIAREAQEAARKAARIEADRLAAEAAKIAAEGRADEARALAQQAAMIPEIAAAAVPVVSTVAGAARTERWSATVKDKDALIRAVCGLDKVIACLEEICELNAKNSKANAADVINMIRGVISANKTHGGSVPLATLEPDMTFLNAQARALRAEMNYPGVEVTSEKTSTIRR